MQEMSSPKTKPPGIAIPNLKAQFEPSHTEAYHRRCAQKPTQKVTDIAEVGVNLKSFGLPPNGNDYGVERTKKLWLCREAATPFAQKHTADYGTFKDSLRAPVHRWFKYPAGYSYRLVEEKIKQYGLTEGHWIFDPFVGSGTTAIEAKRHRVNSIGIEAHPFVHWVAKTKINWDIDIAEIASTYNVVVATAKQAVAEKRVDISELPELVGKCYSPQNVTSLLAIRDAIQSRCIGTPSAPEIRSFFDLALTDTLRNASKAATGWPYIAPTKIHEKVVEREAFGEFLCQVRRMIDDLHFMQFVYGDVQASCALIQGDAREECSEVKDASIDLALTSPPYLNNYDYADRTRLETYFLGWYATWGEITEQVRSRLMMSATTQVRRDAYKDMSEVLSEIREVDPVFCDELHAKVVALSETRRHKGGKKSYDCLVAGYFADMLRTLQQVCRVLKPGADFVLVLGDSAPYGVYIPTHEYIARLALRVGFTTWSVEELRTRGDKWPENPQRHKVKLKEVILTLTKSSFP